MAILFPFPGSKARVRAMNSANWAEVPGGRGLASMVSKLETYLHILLFFFHPRQSCFHQCTRFPQDWSEGLLTIPLGFCPVVQGFETRVKGERALGGRQEGSWVKNLTRGYSETWTFHQHYLISEDSLIRHP